MPPQLFTSNLGGTESLHKIDVVSLALSKMVFQFLTILLGSLAVTWSSASGLPNHYIVLFDASGSVRRDFAGQSNFWMGRTNDDQFMAQRISELVKKVLLETPTSFPSIRENDLFSFLMFRLHYHQPSYLPKNMFMTNKSLLLRRGLPQGQEYSSFYYEKASGEEGTRKISESFGGFSPIVAATATALPYLGQKADNSLRLNRIGRTFIIRITDGSYNANANGSDEYAVILRDIDSENRRGSGDRIPYPSDYARFRELAENVSRTFYIGAKSKECILTTNNVRNPFRESFICSDEAFADIRNPGTGLMISYIEVEPRRPSLLVMMRLERQTVDLQRLADKGSIKYIGENSLKVTASNDEFTHLYPVSVKCRLGEETPWKPCDLSKNGQVMFGENGEKIILDRKKVHLSVDGMALLDKFYFQVSYELSLDGKSPLYPFVYALNPVNLEVRLRVNPDVGGI
jgi:hypothetical protein